MRRDLTSLKEVMTKRDFDFGDSVKLVKERDEKIKQQRSKKKALKKEIEELKA